MDVHSETVLHVQLDSGDVASTHTDTVLIVDDDPANLAIVAGFLTNRGHELVVAADGETGLRLAQQDPPDLILLDVRLPGMDGFETCRRLKEEEWTREVPVIFMTSLNGMADKATGFAVGGVDYLTKPILREDLVARVTTHLALRHAQLDLESRNAQLEAAIKELDSFSYSVSHDLRAPLRALNGFSRILIEDYGGKLDEEGNHLLARIEEGAHRMTTLINEILELSRLSRRAVTSRPIDLSGLAQSIVGELREAEPERRVDVVIADGITAEGDTDLVRALLANLLDNAWKFTGRHETARIEFGSVVVGDSTAFFVRDDGAGFDVADAAKLFSAFHRLHSQDEFEGTGIGLATVQRIVSRHGGRVWAEAEVENGATFYFTLPGRIAAYRPSATRPSDHHERGAIGPPPPAT